MNRGAAVLALLAALLFGVSAPVAKSLLGPVSPLALAGLLYCGAGLGVALLRRLAAFAGWTSLGNEAPLQKRDLPWLGGAILAGGVLAPWLLMEGLLRTEAATASLLLTLEGTASALLAWFVFGENFGWRVAAGMACLAVGALVLTWQGTPSLQDWVGPLAILGACFAWGLDNNLTRQVSLAAPLEIVELKGLVAGPAMLLLALFTEGRLPDLAAAGLAGIVGFVSYGLSLALFVLALRHLGTARTSAYFSAAPFFGALAAALFLEEPVTGQLLAAGALMFLGVWLHVTEVHDHEHTHEEMDHIHAHVHDAHHQHAHGPLAPPGEPHTHWHRHDRLTHRHPHTPDRHHTHEH